MATNSFDQKLNTYDLPEFTLTSGFSSYDDALKYASEKGGTLVEIGFKDGNDNPQFTEKAGLIEKKLHFYVDAGPEYKFIHSSDPGFRDYAEELQKIKANVQELSPDERYLANFEIENTEDPIIVLKNDHLESVTSRERSKYLKQANVYELAVKIDKS